MRRTSHQHGSLKLADRRKGKVCESDGEKFKSTARFVERTSSSALWRNFQPNRQRSPLSMQSV